MNAKSSVSGMVLLEVLISMVLFAFGVLGLVGLQAMATQNSINSQDRAVASILANDMVSLMWIRKNGLIATPAVAADIAAWKLKIQNSNLPDAIGNVTQAGNVATVTITWKAPTKLAADNRNKYETDVVVQP